MTPTIMRKCLYFVYISNNDHFIADSVWKNAEYAQRRCDELTKIDTNNLVLLKKIEFNVPELEYSLKICLGDGKPYFSYSGVI